MEHFDVYGEVHTKYSQVYWTRNTAINLPPSLVARFKGKVMAITGYEVDQASPHSARLGPLAPALALRWVAGCPCRPPLPLR